MMTNNFESALANRRSIYALGKSLPVSENRIEDFVKHAIKHVPASFNSQTSRLVLLWGDENQKLWSLTKDALRKIVPADQFDATESKINSFAAGAGTVLFFEEQSIIEGLQEKFSLYAKNFPIWSEQSSGMLQYVVWTGLADMNVGASLQHYNEVIDADVKNVFQVPQSWKLIAQMPFGSIEAPASEKAFDSVENRLKIFR